MTQPPTSRIRARVRADNAALTAIWLRAVQATHLWLSAEDIAFYLPLVRDDYLPGLEVWVSDDEHAQPAGFIGLTGADVNMLFVDPAQHGKGHGSRLIRHAHGLRGPLTVDVNEQQPQAHAFYLSRGFVAVGRSELDGQGKPFPLIHLAQQ